MAESLADEVKKAARNEMDTSEGWCCDGRTYKEHAHEDGQCCQPKDTQLDALPPDAQEKARERMKQEGQA